MKLHPLQVRRLQLCVFTLQNIITSNASPHSYLLLIALRKYCVMYMYIALEVVTGDNLEKGYAAALELAHAVEVITQIILPWFEHFTDTSNRPMQMPQKMMKSRRRYGVSLKLILTSMPLMTSEPRVPLSIQTPNPMSICISLSGRYISLWPTSRMWLSR